MRRFLIDSSTLVSFFGVATTSSERSTFVRRWPSVPLSVALALEYFFSVVIAAPERIAALSADLPLMTVSLLLLLLLARLPILVTLSQSSDMMNFLLVGGLFGLDNWLVGCLLM